MGCTGTHILTAKGALAACRWWCSAILCCEINLLVNLEVSGSLCSWSSLKISPPVLLLILSIDFTIYLGWFWVFFLFVRSFLAYCFICHYHWILVYACWCKLPRVMFWPLDGWGNWSNKLNKINTGSGMQHPSSGFALTNTVFQQGKEKHFSLI